MSRVKNLAEFKKRLKKREERRVEKPLEPGSPINYPRMVERDYEKKLLKFVRDLDTIVRDNLMPSLEGILREARRENTRFDNFVDDIEATFNNIRVVYGQEITDPAIRSSVEATGQAVDAANASQFASKVAAVTGVQPFIPGSAIANSLRLWAAKNVTLIKTLGEDHLKDIERIVVDGVESGKSLRTISKEIRDKTKVSRTRAKTIARDQVGRLTANVTAKRATDLGVKRFRWVTSLDDRVRASHRAFHNKIFSYEEGADIDGQEGVLPGEPINCRCSLSPILSSIGETTAQTKSKLTTQSDIDRATEREEARQPEVDRRRRAKVAAAREEVNRSRRR